MEKIIHIVKAIELKEEHDWIYGHLYQNNKESYVIPMILQENCPITFEEVDPNTICRLAGKVDMNYIFENDIIQIVAFDLIEPFKLITGKVVWMEKAMCWGIDENYEYGLPNRIPLCEIIRNYTKCEIKKLGNMCDETLCWFVL